MKTQSFPHCCTGKVIVDFGESKIAAGGDRDVTVKEVTDYIVHQLESNRYMGFYTAVTNNEQTVANTALRRLGFHCSPWMEKRQHPETKVRIWWKSVLEYEKDKKQK